MNRLVRLISTAAIVAGSCLISGCSDSTDVRPRTEDEVRLFSPISMQFENFTKVRDWNSDNNPDGVEAVVEFDDSFGDRTKAAGTILFELFDYRQGWADPRGGRVVNPFSASLQTYDEQKAHWERASGAYTFRLAVDGIRTDRNYVLTATYEAPGGDHRLFCQIVLLAQNRPEAPRESSSGSGAAGQPATQP